MGWWSITDDSFRPSLKNKKADTGMHLGDGPADIMDDALKKIFTEYELVWKRKPLMKELVALVKFCGSPMIDEK